MSNIKHVKGLTRDTVHIWEIYSSPKSCFPSIEYYMKRLHIVYYDSEMKLNKDIKI